eukprot:GHVU01034246.1.p1 GENE.GHVU01034246.1~~GHVU01034246.1.p1  ORF type:complete len:118 (-),score=7.06 GHVU01034246.1:32-385(-)
MHTRSETHVHAPHNSTSTYANAQTTTHMHPHEYAKRPRRAKTGNALPPMQAIHPCHSAAARVDAGGRAAGRGDSHVRSPLQAASFRPPSNIHPSIRRRCPDRWQQSTVDGATRQAHD